MTAKDVAWASEETTPARATIKEAYRCGHVVTSTAPTYAAAHAQRLAARRNHACQ